MLVPLAIAANCSWLLGGGCELAGPELAAKTGTHASPQYDGNSASETGDRMNGGAVSDERSPEKDAIDLRL